jgi:hypothetical protein
MGNSLGIKSRFDYTINCPPGGDPELIFKSDGTLIKKSMKVYGFADKGYNFERGTYEIDISTLKKRKSFSDSSKTKFDDEIWSAKIKVKYNNQKEIKGYIFDNGDYFNFNVICNGVNSYYIDE